MVKKRKRPIRKEEEAQEPTTATTSWTKVSVELPEPNTNKNHYDKDDGSKNVDRNIHNLEALPQEDMAMFYGLEVIDGNQYKITNENNMKKIVYLNESSNIGNNNDDNDGDAKKEKKREKKKRKNSHDNETTSTDTTSTDTTSSNDNYDGNKNIKKTKKEKKKLSNTNNNDDDRNNDDSTNCNNKAKQSSSSQKKKTKTKKKNNKTTGSGGVLDKEDDTTHKKEQPEEQDDDENYDIDTIQTSWSVCTGGVILHPTICKSLYKQNFDKPTPIQCSALAPSILGRRNIVGAAPTGSGKTLSYLLPIIQYCIEQQPNEIQQEDQEGGEDACLRALVLTPTRELALQVSKECNKLLLEYNNNKSTKSMIHCNTIVGGISIHKQKRLLKKKPHIIVATPGRLWDLMSSGEYKHVSKLDRLKFLVIDEADRMVNQNSFPQLSNILDTIHHCNPLKEQQQHQHEVVEEEEDSDDDDDPLLLGLPGLPGEAKVQMLNDDILKKLNKIKSDGDDDDNNNDNRDSDDDSDDDGDSDDAPPTKPMEIDDDEYERLVKANNDNSGLIEMDTNYDDNDDDSSQSPPPVQRQTFVYSATLTLPSFSSTSNNRSNSRSKYQVNSKTTIDGAIGEILNKARAFGQTKIIDLTSSSSSSASNKKKNKKNKSATNDNSTSDESDDDETAQQQDDYLVRNNNNNHQRLPPGLRLEHIRCTKRHKDSHLYAYLLTSKQGQTGNRSRLSLGPCLIFCNSIGAVKRIGLTLQTLKLCNNVKMLHANMTQKARFKAIESLKKRNNNNHQESPIVVATDVAARGLDIPSVATVIHYDVPRAVDTFIHRAGRTARGMGEGAVGCSLSLISPVEDKAHDKICDALARTSGVGGNRASGNSDGVVAKKKRLLFNEVIIGGRILSLSQERLSLADKIVSCNVEESRIQKKNQWFIKAAQDADLDLDDDLLDDENILASSGGSNSHERQQYIQAQHAKEKLRALLSVPMQTQKFRKFLTHDDVN